MSDSKPPSSILEVNVPTYIPLSEAAQQHGLSEQALTQLIQAGKIEAVQLPSGELLVPSDGNGHELGTKEELISAKFAHLRGQRISPYAAQKEHEGIHRGNFIRWARAGYIEILHEEEKLIELDAADVAYCAYVYKQKKLEYGGKIAGVKIFDEDGNPYQVKYPDLSERRRA
jgi:hypothetical protein